MSGRIFAVEGVSCAGKTSLCRALAAGGTVTVIPEAPEFLGGLDLCPPPPANPAEARRNEQFYFAVELDRWALASAVAASGTSALLDRCLLSLITLSYAFDRVRGFGTFDAALKDLATALGSGIVGWPDLIIHLDCDPETVRSRNPTRTDVLLPPAWIDHEFSEAQREFYDWFYRQMPVPVVTIDSTAAQADVVDSVRRAIGETPVRAIDAQHLAQLLAKVALP